MGRGVLNIILVITSVCALADKLPEHQPQERAQTSDLNWMRLLNLVTSGEPAVKEVVLVCQSDAGHKGPYVDQSCQHIAGELRLCGITPFIVKDPEPKTQMSQLHSIAPKVNPNAPIFYLTHRGMLGDRHVMEIDNGKSNYVSYTKDVVNSLRHDFPKSPILLNACESGKCLNELPQESVMASSRGSAWAKGGIGTRSYWYMPKAVLPLVNLLCSKELFNHAASTPGVLTGADLEKYYQDHPLYRYATIRESEDVIASASATGPEIEEITKRLNARAEKLREQCPNPDSRPAKCYPAEVPCPPNFTAKVVVSDKSASRSISFTAVCRSAQNFSQLSPEQEKKLQDLNREFEFPLFSKNFKITAY